METFRNETKPNGELLLKSNSKTLEKIYVHPDVSKHLKNHQIDGIKFLFQNCYEENSGCILAHCMGLGKTLQVISLLHAVINSREYLTNKILVLAPVSTLMNWKEEIVRWLGPISDAHRKLKILEFGQKDDIDRKISHLKNWSQCGSQSSAVCLIIGYESFRNLVNFHKTPTNTGKYGKSHLKQIGDNVQKYLLDSADIVICDEGHNIKNGAAALTKAVHQIRTRRRIILTGTPMQNQLMEYYSMVNFVRPNFLGTKQHFNQYFAGPIADGQHADSCDADIKYMKERSYALHKKLSKIVQRREISVLKDFLPEKYEFVLFIPLTPIQYDLYKYFIDNRGGAIESKRLFGDHTCLRKIWTHLRVLDYAHQKSVGKKRRPTNDDDDDDGDDSYSGGDASADEEYPSSGGLQMVKNDWWRKIIDKEQLENAASSHKMIILFEILNECKRVGDKCVIFSTYVEVLNVVEYFMQQIDQRNGKAGLDNFVGPWRKNEDYYRLDGKTKKDQRHAMINKFNDVNNKRTKLMLISSRAGGVAWNPSVDQQSIFRIYRMGQAKQCYIYRLVAMGTMEEKMYSRSVTKQAMSCRVVDKKQIHRHYTMSELHELYSMPKKNMAERIAPIPPKDHVLAHLLQKYPNMIFKYLIHDSLLANKAEEELNDREKKEAWQRCQEQNLQAQALKDLTINGRETALPFKLNSQPALELKGRSVPNICKRAAHSQPNKENMPWDNEIAHAIAKKSTDMEHEPLKDRANHLIRDHQANVQTSLPRARSYEWLPPSNVTPVDTSNDLSLDHFENRSDGSIEVEPVLATMNRPSFTSNEIDRCQSDEAGSSLSNNDQMDMQTSLQRSRSCEWLLNGAETPVESPNDENQAAIENGVSPLAIAEPNVLNRKSYDIEHEDEESSCISDDEQMDMETSSHYSNSCEWLSESSDANFDESLSLRSDITDGSNDSLYSDIDADAEEEEEDASVMEIDDFQPNCHINANELESSVPNAKQTDADTLLSLQNGASNNSSYSDIREAPDTTCNDESVDADAEEEDTSAVEKDGFEPNCHFNANELQHSAPNAQQTDAQPSFPLQNDATGASNNSSYREIREAPEIVDTTCSDVDDEVEEDTSAVEAVFQSNCQFNANELDHSVPNAKQTDADTSFPLQNDVNSGSNDSTTDPPELVETTCNDDSIDADAEEEEDTPTVEKDDSQKNSHFNANEKGHSVLNSKQTQAKPSLGRSSARMEIEDSNGTLIKSPNDDSQRVLLSQENRVDVSNESLNRGTQGNDSIEIAGERSPSTSNETINDSRRENGFISGESKLIDAQTYRERSKSCRCSGDSFTTSVNDTQGAHETDINERCNKSSNREIQQLPLDIGNQNYTEGRVEKSLSDFVKGVLHALNNKYAMPSQQPYSAEDYETEEQIIRPSELNHLEYRITLKRSSTDDIPRPIKRLKLSLEIDPMASITVDHIKPNLPSEFQANAIMGNPQSLKSYDGNEHFSSSNREDCVSEGGELSPNNIEPSKELVKSTESEVVANSNCSEVKESDSIRGENEHDEAMSPNVPEEPIICLDDLTDDDEPVEDVYMSSCEHTEQAVVQSESDRDSSAGMSSSEHTEQAVVQSESDRDSSAGMSSCEHTEQAFVQSESDRDSSAGMSESESQDTDDDLMDDVRFYEEQPSTLSRIRDSCGLM